MKTPSLAQVAGFYPTIKNPPHTYYELKNRKQSSHFPPGEVATFYEPFIAYFLERAQTAGAQARRFEKKLKGPDAKAFRDAEKGWLQAARTAEMRRNKSIDAQVVAEQPGRPPFEWDDESDESLDRADTHRKLHQRNAIQASLFDAIPPEGRV